MKSAITCPVELNSGELPSKRRKGLAGWNGQVVALVHVNGYRTVSACFGSIKRLKTRDRLSHANDSEGIYPPTWKLNCATEVP